MTLDPFRVHEAWCHQRCYLCLIEEIGGQPLEADESFRAAFVVGYFDDLEEVEDVNDEYAGNQSLRVDAEGRELTSEP